MADRMDKGFFCSRSSLERGESMFGTVALIRSWLLIEYPAYWPARAIQDCPGFSSTLKAQLHDAEHRGVFDRALLMRREHRRPEWLRAFRVRSCEDTPSMEQFRFCSYGDMPLSSDPGERVDGLMYAVCTHGRHDKCCAKFGLPAYRELRGLVGSKAWECSHVGGDRFAGNVVVFPYGLYYGRVTPDEVPELVRAGERGEIWLDCYRGRSCFPRVVQIAEYFARRESRRLAINEFRPVLVSRAAEGVSRVDLASQSDGSVHRVVFATRTDGPKRLLTCCAAEPSRVPRHELLNYDVVKA